MLPRAAPPLIGSLAAAAVVFALLLATSSMLPMTWDEGNAIGRAEKIAQWAALVRERGTGALSQEVIARHWHYTVVIEGHPSLYGIAIAAGQWLGSAWLPPLIAARLGPMALFALAAAAAFDRLRREYSLSAALGAMAALVTMPRLFAHAHFASFDGPLTSCWLLSWAAFPTARCVESSTCLATPQRDATDSWRMFGRRWLPPIVWGAALGATMSCKLTGWLAIFPFAGYAVVYGHRETVRTFVIALLAACVAFWLFNPRLWYQPVEGLKMFFRLNLHRAGTMFDIPTLFFGVRYTQLSGLPWYNTLVWTGITVPIGTLLLAAVGIAGALRRWMSNGEDMLIVGNWAALLLVRALVGPPVHDAERLILPSFAFLALLAGLGCHFVAAKQYGRCAAQAGIVVVLLGSASSVAWYAPQWLSYYNVLIGGLRGADAAGMEATYYWDALDGEVLDWLHKHTAPGEKIEFSAPAEENLALMRRWGTLRRDWRADQPGEYRWRVIQRRPTFWTPRDRFLVESGDAVFRKTIRPPAWGFGPWRLDVPLIEVFPAENDPPSR